jgi:hypothetical protein
MSGSDVKSTLGRLLPNPENYWNGGGETHSSHTHLYIDLYRILATADPRDGSIAPKCMTFGVQTREIAQEQPRVRNLKLTLAVGSP